MRRLLVIVLLAAATTAAGWSPSNGAVLAEAGPGNANPAQIGTWRVAPVQVNGDGSGVWQATWSSPTRLPMTSDRATIVPAEETGQGQAITNSGALEVSTPSFSADQRSVSATITADRAPTADDLDVTLSGRLLDQTDEPDSGPVGNTPAPATEQIAEDPAAPGPFAIQRSDYTLDPVKLPGMKQPIEMVGHVVEPTDASATGPRPLVVFLHGRHGVCYQPGKPDSYTNSWPCKAPFKEIPSQLGYDYIQSTLASQGFATVSVRVNGINAQDWRLADGGAGARAAIVAEHLDHWLSIASDHQVDMDQVVLVGHSRGGEGVDRASLRIPTTADYRIVGQVLIAPTDFAHQTAAYVPTVTLLPGCDGDVSDLQGQQFTDVSRDLAPESGAAKDTSLKSSVLIAGANHNFFNTEWTPGVAVAPANDDWFDDASACSAGSPTRLTAAEQRDAGDGYITAAVRLFTGQQQWLPLFDGSGETATAATAYSSALGGGRVTAKPGSSARLGLPDGAESRLCAGRVGPKPSDCDDGQSGLVLPNFANSYDLQSVRWFWESSWDAAGQSSSLLLTRGLDLTGGRLELRTIVDPTTGPVSFRVRLTDADGATATLPEPITLQTLPTIAYMTKAWSMPAIADVSAVSDVDLAHIKRLDLISVSDKGRIWVADVSAAPAALAPVPDLRLATISVGQVGVVEGNGRKPASYRLPLTVNGQITNPARIRVQVAGTNGRSSSYRVDLAPGQTQAWVNLGWQPNRVDDMLRTPLPVAVLPINQMMSDAWVGGLTVTDDDPDAQLIVEPVSKRVTEGQNIVFRVRWSEPTSYGLGVQLEALKPRGRALRTSDIPRDWRKDHYITTKDQPLPGNFWMWESSRRDSAVLRIPTLDDHRTEGPERLRYRISNWPKQKVTGTITVVDRHSSH